MSARKKFTSEELQHILSLFHGDDGVHAVGNMLRLDSIRTVKRLWIDHFGIEAYKERTSRLCAKHKLGSKNPMHGKRSSEHPRWAGEKIISTQGYYLVVAPDWYTGPLIKGSRVQEHTVVACQTLGVTELSNAYIVHHKNENKLDNRPENLEVMNRGAHMVTHRWIKHRKKVQRLSRKGVHPKRGGSAQPREIG